LYSAAIQDDTANLILRRDDTGPVWRLDDLSSPMRGDLISSEEV